MGRIAIQMPRLGYDMDSGQLVAWRKDVGDAVTRGDVIAEIETDKATVEVEAALSGRLVERSVEPGQDVAVGAVIGYIEDGR